MERQTKGRMAAAPGSVLSDSLAPRLVPLCVDLDGTLIRTDILWESVVLLLRVRPLYAFLLPLWMLKGRAYLKHRLSSTIRLDPSSLPYNEDFVVFLKEQHLAGRPLVLATASDREAVEPIANHVGIFAHIVASDGSNNLKGAVKAARLVSLYGQGGFDYAGNSSADIPIWQECDRVIVVNAYDRVARRAGAIRGITKEFPKQSRWKALPHALRVHQWVKNLLVALPLLTSHQIFRPDLLLRAGLAFAAFSFCASSVYICNDLLDLDSDRRHPKKRKRPFAAGNLSIVTGLTLAACLLGASAAVSSWLPRQYQLILAIYYVLTLAYSLSLKKKLLVDVFLLGGLYVLRVLAGSSATAVAPSPWLLAFCLFFFLSLALVKRYTELLHLCEPASTAVAGRGYIGSDLPIIGSLGAGSGFMCVLVLALYINSPQVVPLYRNPALLWFLCPLILYWISRVWVLAGRGALNADPVLFALRDKVSYLTALSGAAIMMAAARGLEL